MIEKIIEFLGDILPYVWIWWSFAIFLFAFKIVKAWWKYEAKMESIDKVNEDIKKINTDISEIKWNINFIISRIDKMDWGFTQTKSPISLTKKWEDLAKEEEIYDSIAIKWQEIKTIINENCKDLNPYDIQQFILKETMLNLDKFLDEKWLERLKIRAYKEWVKLEALARIIAVIIRNKFFEDEKININDIDKHDPNI